MNDRIRELYYECQDESQSTEQCYQKFAELILHECIVLCEDGEDTQMTSIGAALRIKQHFGIH
jgi:hypothetical protein